MRYDDRPDVMFASVMCLSLRKVRIGEACHVSSWGNPDRNACHVSLGGGVLQQEFPTRPILVRLIEPHGKEFPAGPMVAGVITNSLKSLLRWDKGGRYYIWLSGPTAIISLRMLPHVFLPLTSLPNPFLLTLIAKPFLLPCQIHCRCQYEIKNPTFLLTWYFSLIHSLLCILFIFISLSGFALLTYHMVF